MEIEHMKINTHTAINQTLCGNPATIEQDYCMVRLETQDDMRVDEHGLVHGGFIFGVADYAAMLAVNQPNVVLGAAEVQFLKPVKAKESKK